MKEEMICRFCKRALDLDEHGNRRHCDDDCSMEHRKIRNKNKYWEQKSQIELFQKADLLLKLFFELYGSKKFIPALLLDDAGMDWAICRKEIDIEGNLSKQINQYAYCLFTNETVKIWKIQNL